MVDDRDEDGMTEMLMLRGEADRGGDAGEHQDLPAPAQPERPLVVQLHVVVEEADRAAGERRAEDRQRRQRVVGERQERERSPRSISRPPIVGVPCLADMVLRPLLADVLADLVPAQERDEGRPAEDRDDHGDERRNENSGHYAVKFSATTSSPTDREPLTSTTSPGRSRPRSSAAASAAVGDPVAAVVARQLADRDHVLDPELAERAPRSRGGSRAPRRRARAISPSTATQPSAVRRARRGAERRTHRHRVRVVTVVQEQTAARQLALLLTQLRELDRQLALRQRHPEHLGHGDRGARVRELVRRRVVRRERDRRLVVDTLDDDVRAVEVRLEQRLVGHDRDATGGSASISSAFAARDVLDRRRRARGAPGRRS